jgi:hypothetical protein
LARVLAAILDQPVQLRDRLVLVDGQHLFSLFSVSTWTARFVALSCRPSAKLDITVTNTIRSMPI